MLPRLPTKTRKSLLFSEELEKFSYNSLKDLVDIGKFWIIFYSGVRLLLVHPETNEELNTSAQ